MPTGTRLRDRLTQHKLGHCINNSINSNSDNNNSVNDNNNSSGESSSLLIHVTLEKIHFPLELSQGFPVCIILLFRICHNL